MNKSTRAPWFVGETLNGLPAIIGDGDSVVAYMPSEANGCTYKPNDAHLMAAAPSLLLSNERLLGNFRLLLSGKPVRDVEETIAEAEQAIAAATEEPK